MPNTRLAKFIRNNGKPTTTLIVAGLSVVASLVITTIVLLVTGSEIDPVGMSAAVVAPLLISPPITWYIVGLLLRIQEFEQEQRKLASIDHLTQLFNRRQFLHTSQQLLESCRLEQKCFSVAMLDLDKFKSINDTYGHEAGDEVLISVSSILRRKVCTNTVIGRLGGEEFAMSFADSDLDAVTALLEELRLEVSQQVTHYKSDSIKYTMSLGLASSEEASADLSPLLAQADSALYRAKTGGRNRLEIEH